MRNSIMIADEDRLVRDCLKMLLELNGRFQVIAEAEDGRDAVKLALEKKPDVILIDALLPKLSGIEAVRQIRSEQPRCRAIVTSKSHTSSQVRAALLAGAIGFLPKSTSARELVDAVQSVAAGRPFLSQSISDSVASAIRSAETEDSGPWTLTARQREVLQLIAEGMSTKEIAQELGVSLKTAQTHRAKLMERVGVRKASMLVRYAIREGIITA